MFDDAKMLLALGVWNHPSNDFFAYGKGNESVLHWRCFSHRSELLLHPPQHAQEPRAKCSRATQLESQEIQTGPKQQMSAGSAGKFLWFWSSPFLSEASTADFSSRLGNWPRRGRGDWRCQHGFSGWMLKVVEGAEAVFLQLQCAEFFTQVSRVLKNEGTLFQHISTKCSPGLPSDKVTTSETAAWLEAIAHSTSITGTRKVAVGSSNLGTPFPIIPFWGLVEGVPHHPQKRKTGSTTTSHYHQKYINNMKNHQ